LLAGIVVGAISPVLGWGIDRFGNPLLALLSVPLVALIWRALSTESTKPSLWHFAHLVPIAFFAPLVSVFAVMGGNGVRGAGFYIFVSVMGVIVGTIFSGPYAWYVGSGQKAGLFIFLGICILFIALFLEVFVF